MKSFLHGLGMAFFALSIINAIFGNLNSISLALIGIGLILASVTLPWENDR
jgi:glutamyl-tRNA reductase